MGAKLHQVDISEYDSPNDGRSHNRYGNPNAESQKPDLSNGRLTLKS
jgi:hypothetical protein